MPALDFWFDFASTYSYVAALRIHELAATRGVEVRHRPFLLGPLFTAQLGIRDSPFNVHERRGRYMWRDLERLCSKHDLPFKRPSVFPRNSVLAARVATVGAAMAPEPPWLPKFVRSVFLASFADDFEIADRGVIRSLLEPLGAGALAGLDAAETPDTKARLRAATDEADKLGIFGAPDFVVAGELFFGQDRLEDALAWASQPARP